MSRSLLPADRRPVIVAARRSAIGRAGGMFRDVDLENIAAPVLRAALADTPFVVSQIDDVILGNAAGPGGNIARLSALVAWQDISVPGVTTDRQCGAGLEAVIHACRLIQAGAGDVYVAGGAESHSRKPLRALPGQKGKAPNFYDRARFSPDTIGDPEMGAAADVVAQAHNITRERQDAFALRSHSRAIHAQTNGAFDTEIVSIEGQHQDECPRDTLSPERLARLRPAFGKNGTVTVGNACPLNDGAAALVVTSAGFAKAHGITHALEFLDAASAGVDPNLLGIGPVASTRKLLDRNPEVSLGAVTHLEFNEAFAAQVLASLDLLAVSEDLANAQGGAIALGHPFGASGAILVTRLFAQLVTLPQPETALAMAMIGIGGGQGLTAMFRPAHL
ncbi:thiolase family protein [Shimia litoralis]|nr:thiolase family protein [Shimia litoralis]